MSRPDCYKGFVLLGEPKGSMIGPDYFTPARGDSSQPTKAIVLLTDIFGLPSPNPKIVADHLAEHVGVDVWVPDFFNGKPPFAVKDLEPHMPDRAGVKIPFTKMFVILFKILASLPRLFANRPSVVDPRVHAVRSLTWEHPTPINVPLIAQFINKVKSEKGYERIGAVGYCFGGAIAGRLGSTDLVNTIVVAHPINLIPAQIRAIKVPTSWVLAEDDMGFKEKDVKTARSIFTKQEVRSDHVDYEFKIWSGKSSFLAHQSSPHTIRLCIGTAHGFAMRPNLEVPEVKAGYEGGLEQTVAWFKKTCDVAAPLIASYNRGYGISFGQITCPLFYHSILLVISRGQALASSHFPLLRD
ncbi:Alpha/Beta hydrolase protein [Lactarius quietus]|nr:Alpha/Beta hydrolase protein [Lactarius quietus]